jgi:hypothetical protein
LDDIDSLAKNRRPNLAENDAKESGNGPNKILKHGHREERHDNEHHSEDENPVCPLENGMENGLHGLSFTEISY